MLKGVGTVVTGTLTGGAVRAGTGRGRSAVGRAARVRTVQTHNAEVETVGPGNRVALSLPDLQVDAEGRSAAGTSAAATSSRSLTLGKPSETIDVVLERSARDERGHLRGAGAA